MDNLENYTDRIINLKVNPISNFNPDSIIGSEDSLKEIRKQYPLDSNIIHNSKRDDSIMTRTVCKAIDLK